MKGQRSTASPLLQASTPLWMGCHGENTDSALGHVTEQPGPALKLRNVGPLRGWRGPHFQDLGHHCQSGAGAEPLPAYCSQHCGHVCYADWENPQLTLFTLLPLSGPPHLPLPVPMEMDWFCTYKVPRSCLNIEKTTLLSRVEGPSLQSDSGMGQ